MGLDNNIINRYVNITTAPYKSYSMQRLFDYQLTLTRVLKEVITLAFKIEMQTSIREISRILYSNLGWLIFCGTSFLVAIAALFARKTKGETNAKLGVISVLRVMQTLPPELVFRNPSAYYMLRHFFE